MCHSFETYDPKIAIREVEQRLTAPAPDFAFLGAWAAATRAALARAATGLVRAETLKEAAE